MTDPFLKHCFNPRDSGQRSRSRLSSGHCRPKTLSPFQPARPRTAIATRCSSRPRTATAPCLPRPTRARQPCFNPRDRGQRSRLPHVTTTSMWSIAVPDQDARRVSTRAIRNYLVPAAAVVEIEVSTHATRTAIATTVDTVEISSLREFQPTRPRTAIATRITARLQHPSIVFQPTRPRTAIATTSRRLGC